MRNLKRVLSLALALVMMLGMMIITSSAAEAKTGFADADDIEYVEAADVLNAIGVIEGVDEGSDRVFNPDEILTREQAAAIISRLLLGEANADKLGNNTQIFVDVAAGRWSAGYIAYCSNLGIIAGDGAGNFDPTGELTGVAFAKMLLVALGYDAKIEGYVDSADWATNVGVDALAAGIDVDGVNLSDPLTREQAAQMALNTIKAPLVEYRNKGVDLSVNGAAVSLGASQATYVTSTIAREQTISSQRLTNGNGWTIEFAEKYCPKLELKEEIDAFGRPTYTWTYDRQLINSYVNTNLLIGEYTSRVTGEELYNLIGSSTLKDANTTVDIYIDGEVEKDVLNGNSNAETYYFTAGNLVKGNDKAVGGTGNGVLTQVFEKTIVNGNDTDTEITIAIINTYLAIADSDYTAKQNKASFTVYSVEDVTSGAGVDLVKNTKLNGTVAYVAPLDASGDDFDVEDVKEGDIVLVTVADGAIQTIEQPEVLAETAITAFTKGSSVTVDGTKYNYAATAKYDEDVLDNYTGINSSSNLKNKTYNVYFDPYGYVIGVEEVEGTTNYVFITGYDGNLSNLSNKTADMGAIFMDGTMKTIKVNVSKSSADLFDENATDGNAAKGATSPGTDSNSNGVVDTEETYSAAIVNTWCTYTVSDDDVYTLTIADGTGNQKANQSRQSAYSGNTSITIDTKRVQLKDATGSNYVFGNDSSVYINTELKKISIPGVSGAATTATIINGVDSVTVGTRNVSLEVTDKTALDADKSSPVAPNAYNFTPIYEIYTLYDRSTRDIIGVITLDAEDNGTNSVYAYVTSNNVSQESYSSSTREYTWSRKVVINGELTDVTYVGDTLENIDSSTMVQGNWYELKLDSDGNVRKVETLPFAAVNAKYVNTVAGVVTTWNAGQNVDILCAPASKLTFSEGTLWTDETATTGISVSSDVKVVVCNADGTGRAFSKVVDGYAGYSGLKSAINDLNDNFTGTVSATYSNGRAVSIILNCTAADPNYSGGQETPQTGDAVFSSVVDEEAATALGATAADSPLNLKKAYVDDTNHLKLPAHYGQNVKQQLLDALDCLGYSVNKAEYNGQIWTFTVTKDGMTEEITCDVTKNSGDIGVTAAEYALITVDTTKAYVAVGSQPTIATPSTNPGTGFIVKETGDSAFKYGDTYKNGYTAVTGKDAEIKTGYVKVTISGTNPSSSLDGLSYGVTAPTVDYAQAATAGANINVTITVTGTSSDTTAKTIVVGGTDVAFAGTDGGTLTAETGSVVTGITSAVRTSGTTLTFTPKGSDTVDATYKINLTVKNGDATITIPNT